MFKKILIATAILTSSSAVFASASPYVGAALGVNTITSTSGGNYRGVPVDLFAGYGATINTSFYLGGELFITPFTGSISKSDSSGNLKTTYGYGASILPGVMFSDHTLGYVRAGAVRSHFSAIDQNKTSWQLGVGMQTTMAQDLDLRAEYAFTPYSNIATSNSPRSDAFKLGILYKLG